MRDGRAYSGLILSSRSGMVFIRHASRASLSLALHTTSPSAATAGGNELTREYTAATDTYYQYDGSGNTVAKQEASGTTYYQYDFENGMTRIDFGDDSHNYFGYDADSKRVEKRDSEGYTRFVYQGPDMLKLLQEQDAGGDAVVQYTMGGALEAMRRSNGGGLSGGATSFYHFDWLGSTFALTDATAAATDTYLYDAWGGVLNRTGTLTNPHTYIGKERYYRMPNASLYHLGFRDYAAGVGRFVTLDPQRDGTNWFAYVGSAPSHAADPSGATVVIPPWLIPDEETLWRCLEGACPSLVDLSGGTRPSSCWLCITAVAQALDIVPSEFPNPFLGFAIEMLDCAANLRTLCDYDHYTDAPATWYLTLLDCATMIDDLLRVPAPVEFLIDLVAFVVQQVEQGFPIVHVPAACCVCLLKNVIGPLPPVKLPPLPPIIPPWPGVPVLGVRLPWERG